MNIVETSFLHFPKVARQTVCIQVTWFSGVRFPQDVAYQKLLNLVDFSAVVFRKFFSSMMMMSRNIRFIIAAIKHSVTSSFHINCMYISLSLFV